MAIAVTVPAAYAQQATDSVPTLQLERIEITGSSIKRIESEGSLPVQVFSRSDIDRTGAHTVADFLQAIPAAQGMITSNDSVGGGGGGMRGISLHNVGQNETLVLLDGHRIATFGGQTLTGGLAAIDLNSIPMAEVDHIEVLSDGASALYGSDAIGGVVNIITKRNFSGGQVNAAYNSPQRAGARSASIGGVKGFGDLATDGYNVLVAVNAEHEQGLMASQRSFAKTGNILFSENGVQQQFFNGSPRTAPANITGPGITTGIGYSNYYAFTNGGACPPDALPLLGSCFYDYDSKLQIAPEQRHESASLDFRKRVGEMTIFAKAIYAKSTTSSTLAAPPGEVVVAQGTSLWTTYAAPQGATGDVTAWWRLADAGGRNDIYRTTAQTYIAGAEGLYAGWDYSAAFTHSTSESGDYNYGGYVTQGGIQNALSVCNPFLLPGQQSAACMSAIEASKINGFYDGGRSTLDQAEARASKEIFTLPAGPASLGVGVNVLREGFSLSSSNLAQGIGDVRFGDVGGDRPYSGSRHSIGVFGELLTPLAKGLELTTSLRDDHYSDFGNTLNGKVAARWEPVKQLMVRASYGTGFKAPTVPQVDGTQQLYGVTSGSYTCPLTTAQLAALGNPACDQNVQFQQFAQGNLKLQPETSHQWDLGIRYEPTNSVSLGVDFWAVHLYHAIGQIPESLAFGPQSSTLYQNLFITYFDPGSQQNKVAFLPINQNLGANENHGLDFDFKFGHATPIGNLRSNIIATYMIKATYEPLPGAGYVDTLKEYQSGITLRWQGRWINTLDVGPTSNALTLNFKSGYPDQAYSLDSCYTNLASDPNVCTSSNRTVAHYITADWRTSWTISKNFSGVIGITNLFNTDPPLTIKSSGGGQPLGFDGRYADPLGRTFNLEGKFTF